MKYRGALCLLLFICMSCSLDYPEEERRTDGIPEFVFLNAQFVRFEGGNVSAELAAQQLEQYRSDDSLYGRGVVFKTYAVSGALSAEGSCSLLAADASAELYTLIGGISIISHEQQVRLQGDTMKWNGRTEQLVSGADDTVSVSRIQHTSSESSQTEIQLSGKALSASGISRSFAFAGPVTGTIYTGTAAEGGGE